MQWESFTLAEDRRKEDYDIVVLKFDEYSPPRRNIIYTWAYISGSRGPAKKTIASSEPYINCQDTEFGVTKEENILNRIVIGILDKELSHWLQLIADLTLVTTIHTIRQAEEVLYRKACHVKLWGQYMS